MAPWLGGAPPGPAPRLPCWASVARTRRGLPWACLPFTAGAASVRAAEARHAADSRAPPVWGQREPCGPCSCTHAPGTLRLTPGGVPVALDAGGGGLGAGRAAVGEAGMSRAKAGRCLHGEGRAPVGLGVA